MIDAHKNKFRAPIFPLNARTLALTSLGLGFLRPAPGTWGSMPPPAIFFVLLLLGAGTATTLFVLGAMLILSCVLCVTCGEYAEERFGRKDAGEVVIDETAGQTLTLLLGSIGHVIPCTPVLRQHVFILIVLPCVASFVLFRFFDIVKPWPARRLESLPAGWGVLADDLMAGLYAGIAMQVFLWLTISGGMIR